MANDRKSGYERRTEQNRDEKQGKSAEGRSTGADKQREHETRGGHRRDRGG